MPEALALLSLQRWIFQAVAMTATSAIIPGLRVTSIFGPFLAVISLAFINSHLWSTALFFHIPDTFTAHVGLLLLSNGIIFWVLVKLLPGIEVSGILPALVAPIVFTVLSVLVEEYASQVDWPAVGEFVMELFQELREYFQSQPGLEKSGS